MPNKPSYDKMLDKLMALLKRKPMTARQIADALDCCRPSAYQRLQALRKRGVFVYTMPPQKGTGPGVRPVYYWVR
jgi:predicted ArsR family transcriptional regulator